MHQIDTYGRLTAVTSKGIYSNFHLTSISSLGGKDKALEQNIGKMPDVGNIVKNLSL